MAAPTPANMDDCDPKCRCSYGPYANQAYSCDDPCAGQGDGCTFDCGAGCECDPPGECYGGRATYTPCGGEPTCFYSASLKCEESLGGCPSFVEKTDTSVYGCGNDFPDSFSLSITWQYPDGSFAQTDLASGTNTQIESGATIQVLSGVACGSGPC